MSTAETQAPFKISKESRINLPLALLLSLLAVVAAGTLAWSETRGEVASTKVEVSRNAADIIDLKSEARQTREILIRIDENVKDLRLARRNERSGP